MNKKTLCLNLDIISNLPQNIIETILTLMPLRDALRMSVLSKKWRYSWRSMPKLVFTDNMVTVPSSDVFNQLKICKLVKAIFHVLRLHNCPTILVFSCSVGKLGMVSEFELMLSFLSRGNTVRELIFVNDKRSYKLPASFFSLQGLELICLEYCTFELPLTFSRFSFLKSLNFMKVEISAQMLQRFLSKCPMLEHISLNGYQKGIDFVSEGNKFTFVDLLRCVPLIKTLNISRYYMKVILVKAKGYISCKNIVFANFVMCMCIWLKYLSAGCVPHKLPTSLVHLENLFLEVCMTEQYEISSALCMIRSSPMLVKIAFMMYDNKKVPDRQTSISFLDPEDYSNLYLDHLEIFKIETFSTNLHLMMDLVKLIMAKSPVLKTVQIELQDNISVFKEVEMLRDLVLLPVQRASPSAKLIIARPKTYDTIKILFSLLGQY